MGKIVKTLTLDADILESLRRIAEYEDCSVSELVTIILSEHISGKYYESDTEKVLSKGSGNKSKKMNFTVNIDDTLLNDIEELAKANNKKFPRYINRVFKNYLKESGYKFE